jgi:hypothetical protein
MLGRPWAELRKENAAQSSRRLMPMKLRRGFPLAMLNVHSRQPILVGMAKKPEPAQTIRWDVYKVAAKAIWLGTVEAPPPATSSCCRASDPRLGAIGRGRGAGAAGFDSCYSGRQQ